MLTPKLHLFEQKYSKNSNIMKYYYNLKELFSIMQSWILSIINPDFSVTWSFRNYSDMLNAAQQTFIISTVSVLKTVELLNIFVEIFFRILWWIESSKEQHLFEIFCNNVKVSVTFLQFNASLINKVLIYLFIFKDSKLLNGSVYPTISWNSNDIY